MKVLLIGKSGLDSLERNLQDVGAEIFGDEVTLIDFPKIPRFIAKDRRLRFLYLSLAKWHIGGMFLSRKLIVYAQKLKPELVIVLTGASDYLSAETVQALKEKVKGPIVCWFVDASVNLGTGKMLFAPYDHYFFTDRGLLRWLQPFLKEKASLLMEGFHPLRHNVPATSLQNREIVVVGSLYPARVLMLEELVKVGFNIRIYGPGLPPDYGRGLLEKRFQDKYLVYEDKSRVFNEALCVLNNFHPSTLDAINCRVFEVLAAEGLLVTEYSTLLHEVFDSSNLLTYKTFDDLVELLTGLTSGEIDADAYRRKTADLKKGHSLVVRYEAIRNSGWLSGSPKLTP